MEGSYLQHPLWKPSKAFQKQSDMNLFMEWVNGKFTYRYSKYEELWEWSISDSSDFWESILNYYNVKYSGSYKNAIQKGDRFYDFKWFQGIKLSYAEHIFRNANNNYPAIVHQVEKGSPIEVSWDELRSQVAKMTSFLKSKNIQKGDVVCAILTNGIEAIVGFLAANSLGAIWSSCSPDFGSKGIIERFGQINPKLLFASNNYSFNGTQVEISSKIESVLKEISSIQLAVFTSEIPSIKTNKELFLWNEIPKTNISLSFVQVDFNHPIYVLYSSGTTGSPKAITHQTGGIILEHFKALGLHHDVKKGDRFFWQSTIGWMMWNYSVSSLLLGATLCVYDGSPFYPKKDNLWKFAIEAKLTHFGASAAYFDFCRRVKLNFTNNPTIQKIKSIGSTGSPLSDDCFKWIYNKVNPNVWLISLSGGTDICSGFVGGNPFNPVYKGEIQCRMLGVNLRIYSERGKVLLNNEGEMVIVSAMPSMPVFFWGDKEFKRYNSSYFEFFDGVWRHGDWAKVNGRGGLKIFGRSDATLNRGGVRIGTSEIYRSVESLSEINDSLVVSVERSSGVQLLLLFVELNNIEDSETLHDKINQQISSDFSIHYVPNKIISVPEIPYTISGKKMETPIKKILSGIPVKEAIVLDVMKNPKVVEVFNSFYKEKLS